MTQVSIAIYCMIIASLLPFSFTMIAKISAGFRPKDNQNPRQLLASAQGLAARANAAQLATVQHGPTDPRGIFTLVNDAG